jgi:hypothetical protein
MHVIFTGFSDMHVHFKVLATALVVVRAMD